jgi:hypothetical protein
MEAGVKFPKHECGLTLEHNSHKDYYETVEQYLAVRYSHCETEPFDWAEGEREKAIATNELWVMQWYPRTPIGFLAVAASTFEMLMAAVDEAEGE